jgi:hypothetical protein
MDSVGTMLVNSNFLNNASTLIYEETENVITSAYVSKSSNESSIVSLYDQRFKPRNLSLFNFPKKKKMTISYIDKACFVNRENPFFKFFAKKYLMSFNKYCDYFISLV